MDKSEKYVYQQMVRLIGGVVTTKNCEKYVKAFIQAMTTELLRSGELRIDNFGKFNIAMCKGTGGVFRKYDINAGEVVERYIEPRYTVKFTAFPRLKADIEGKELTPKQQWKKEQKKKVKKPKKTPEQIEAERKLFLERKK